MRVLIADDDVTSRLLLQAMTVKLGHETLTAEDGSSAWTLLGSGGFDVLLTDWMMPGVDGTELCRRVREELPGYLYIVLITGLGYPEQVLEGMNAGADDYLIKPVDSFAVETRLVAASRVTALHRQLALFRERLEMANAQLLGQSLTDPLTGLGNRRRLDDDLAKTHAQAVRTGRGYAIAMFDIDHFKLYNDHYGHLEGDEALSRVAHCIVDAHRVHESVYRYGGEEFLLLLPETTLEEGAVVANRISGKVAGEAIAHEARPQPPEIVTLSGGVSAWTPDSRRAPHEVLESADAALFEAKAAGRNRVHVAGRASVGVANRG